MTGLLLKSSLISPNPVLPSLVISVVFLIVYRQKIESKKSFLLFSVLICLGVSGVIKAVATAIFFSQQMTMHFTTFTVLGPLIWFIFSILCVKLFSKYYISPNKQLNQNGAEYAPPG
jgi:hypothetical protein